MQFTKTGVFARLKSLVLVSVVSCCDPHYESRTKCKPFHIKISFVCI